MSGCPHGISNAAWCQHCINEKKTIERANKVKEAVNKAKVKAVGQSVVKFKRAPVPEPEHRPDPNNKPSVLKALVADKVTLRDKTGRSYSGWTIAPANCSCQSHHGHRVMRGQLLVKSLVETRTNARGEEKPVWV